MFSSVFAPKPFRPFSAPALMASARSATEAIPSSWYRTMAFFGPRPGIAVISRTPGGILARSSSTAWTFPVSQVLQRPSRRSTCPTFGMACETLDVEAGDVRRGSPPIDRAAFS